MFILFCIFYLTLGVWTRVRQNHICMIRIGFFFKKHFRKNNFFVRTIINWNKLPKEIMVTHQKPFKEYVKNGYQITWKHFILKMLIFY